MYRIKEVMIEKGIKSKDLAEKLGKTKQYISNVVNGSANVSMQMLSEIANALDVPLWMLIASREEVFGNQSTTIVCPKCGSRFKLEEESDNE